LTAVGDTAPDATGLRKKLARLGFALDKVEADEARYVRGDLRLGLKPFRVAGMLALEAKIKDRKIGKEKTRVLVGRASLPKKVWRRLESGYAYEMERVLRRMHESTLKSMPRGFEDLKVFEGEGEAKQDQIERAIKKLEIKEEAAKLGATITRLRAEGRAPKGVIVLFEGPDGAGKSSTAKIVAEELVKSGYSRRDERFKAPTEEEKKQHWLKRFERGIPAEGEAVIWDRGPASDFVYRGVDAERGRAMAKETVAFEQDLAKQGILLIKVEIHASVEKQAHTFGKRLARQKVALGLENVLAEHHALDRPSTTGLDDVTHRIDGDDFRALASYDKTEKRFQRFIRMTDTFAPWLSVDATRRHPARLELIDGVSGEFDRFAATLERQ
jgi:polyphosphate kinase 2 (PPK2 family)